MRRVATNLFQYISVCFNIILSGSRIIFLILFFLFYFQTSSQKYLSITTYNVDSLNLILPDQVGEERVNTLNHLAISLYFKDDVLSSQYAEEAMILAHELDYQEGIASAFRNFGYINVYRSQYPDALNNFFESLQIYEDLNRKHTIADLYYDIAFTHFFANTYDKALDYALISLDLFQEQLEEGGTVGYPRDTFKVLGVVYLTYWYMGINRQERLEIILQMFEDESRTNFHKTESIHAFIEFGANYLAVREIDSAHKYLDKALEFPDINQDVKALKHRAMIWKSYLHQSLDEYDTAIFYLDTAYKWYNNIGYLFGAMELANDLGNRFYYRNDIKKAEKYFEQAELIFNEIVQKNSWYRHDSLKNVVFWGLELYVPIPPSIIKLMNWLEVTLTYYRLFQIYEKLNRTDEALKYHKTYANAADTLNRLQRNVDVLELQTRYESERKDQQIDTLSLENELQESLLRQNRYLLFGSAGLFVIILMFGYILFRQNKLKADQQMLVLQQKLFRLQMNPHFLFNSLSSIHNYIVHENSAKAAQYLLNFSSLVRNILDCSVQEYIPLDKEISAIGNYLDLQKNRFADKFDYSIKVDEAIDPESINIPPMLLQPFIENSIEHGFKYRKEGGNINISFFLENGKMIVDLEDNGIGRKKAQELLFKENKDHKSLATTITRERIHVLSKKLKKKIKLSILDLKNEKGEAEGTKVMFEIPLIY